MTASGTIDVHTPIAGLIELALRDPSLHEVTRRAAERPADLDLIGPASARVYAAAAIAQTGPLLVVTATGREADDLTAELRGVFGDSVALFPSWETLPHERLSPGTDTVGARMLLLRRLAYPDDARLGPPVRIVVTTARSLLQPMAPDLARTEPVTLTVGEDSDFDTTVHRLVELAYTRVDMVGKRGEFAVRGGILDVFPPTLEHPVRVEFWGDEVSELRMFSVADQRSIPEIDIDFVVAVACRELLLTDDVRDRAAALAAEHPVVENSVPGSVPDMLAKLAEGIPVDGMEALLPLLKPTELATLPDHLPAGAPLLICDPEKVRTRAADLIKTGREFLEASWSTAAVGGDVPIDIEALGASGFLGFDDARDNARAGGHPWWTLSQLDSGSGEALQLDIRPAPSARGQQHNLDEIFAMLRAHVMTGGHAAVVTPGAGTCMRVVEQLGESDTPATMLEPGAPLKEGVVGVLKGPLHDGVVLPGANLVVITETDLTGNRAGATEGKKLAAKRRNVVDPLALTAGDLVVHDQHGIGRFVEMTERVVGGARREYLVLEYASSKRGQTADRLYVPMDSLDQLSRYVGGEAPTLSKLGGSDWANTKTKARRAVREIAAELVALYAKRQASPGHAFAPDTPWQLEMEDAFGFTETVDQLTAITEVKSDMEKPVPMDRVICGDVGYGKTEIAVRAAFKAVQDGKQVAVLVPTTLLADQHLQTFAARTAGFPVTVKGLSRFTDPAESRATLEGMKDGSVDIVIGTHRLLQTGVTWKDLGLIVVDEEQRFGVEHKEHIKSMRTHVDVLTMSATPIPRTLEMSLAGIREMSTILTPPEERYPVLTYVGPHDDKQVAAALRREMLRDGQAFYIHNRVRSIDQAAARVRQMVPEARVVVAHGQMPEEQLEKTVEGFWNREYDILVCTTIVESGLDIPRVNTILIEDSQKFGLSQLYQLRGRVGRSGIQAHAWLFYPGDASLSDAARQRLRAIQEFAQLGSGYQLAMRDMEIRGVGNLLGVEQSGQMETIGFDLYMEMLQEELAEIRGQDIPAVDDTQIDLSVSAFIPADWVTEADEKMAAYRAAADCDSREGLLQLAADWVDRYGPLPAPVQSLLQMMEIKLLAKRCGFSRIKPEKPNLVLETPMEEPAFRRLRQGLSTHLHGRLVYQAGSGTTAKVLARGLGVLPPDKQLDELKSWLETMAAQIPDADGLSAAEREAKQQADNAAVLSV